MSRVRRLFPDRIDNAYHGHVVAMWTFAGVTLISIARSLIHVLAPDGGAQSIAMIPLDRMTPPGATANLVLPAVALVMLWLSLRGARDGRDEEGRPKGEAGGSSPR